MSKSKIYMKQKKGFTLLEVLISATIFAVIMLMVVATISQTSFYQTKLQASRRTAEHARNIADQLSRDIAAARGGNTTLLGSAYNSGIIEAKCDNHVEARTVSVGDCALVNSQSPNTEIANALILFSEKSYQVYGAFGGNVYYRNYDSVAAPTCNTGNQDCLNDIFNGHGVMQGQLLNADNQTDGYQAFIDFTGFAPDKSSTERAQPYVKFVVTVRSENYEKLPAAGRADAVIESMVTSRNYNWTIPSS